MTTSRASTGESHPYLRAASAGLRHHAKASRLHVDRQTDAAADRLHLDLLHAHLIACHQLVDQLGVATRPTSPTAGHHLAAARTRLWQAASDVHDAFHTLPPAGSDRIARECDPERIMAGPPFVTVCQRHQAAIHIVRRTTTPAEIDVPLHGHTTNCGR